jgi:hypothetical protein
LVEFSFSSIEGASAAIDLDLSSYLLSIPDAQIRRVIRSGMVSVADRSSWEFLVAARASGIWNA